MMYTQRPVRYAGFAPKKAKKRDYAWSAAAALVCALLIWVAVQIRDQSRTTYAFEGQLPRNTVDMHGIYTGVAPEPWMQS